MNVSREHSGQRQTQTVLIIDEHPAGLDVISGPLQARGLELALAQDGAAGLARARALKPDLVLLGAALPDMQGLEICRRLKASAGVRDAPVIFMLAADEAQYVNQYFEAGAADYVSRPFQAAPALARISAHLRLRALQGQAAAQTQAENSLRQQAYLLENVSDAIIFTDLDFVIQGWNQAAAEIYGWRADEVMGKSTSDVLRPDYPYDSRTQMIEQFLADGYWKGEALHHHRDGTPIHILGSVKLLKDEQGRPFGVVSANRDVSERKRAEEALRESARQLRLISDNLPAYVGYLDVVDWRYRFVNHKYEQAFGFPREQIIGAHARDIIGEENFAFAWEYMQRARTGKTVSYENAVKFQHEKRWLEINYVPELDEQGRVVGVIVLSYDITARKEAEKALQESEANLRAVAENAFDGILVYMGGQHVFANQRIADMLGYNFAELLGTTLNDIVHPDERDKVSGRFQRRQAGRAEPNQYETVYVSKSGQSVPVEITATTTTWQGQAAGLVVIRDISERLRAEESLRESEERFRKVFEQEAFGMAMSDQDFYFFKVNAALCAMLGYSEQEFSRLTFKDITHPDYIGTDLDNVLRLTRGEISVYQTEKRYIAKSGQVLWGALNLSVLRDANGKFLYYLVIIEDITERKQAEEKLQEYSERLEEMVEERTRELCEAQEQLVRRERLAVLGQLAGGVAHELRNPLGAIKNATYYLNMVLEEPEGGVRDTLGILNKEVETSERIISSLLDFARVKSPVRRAVDLNRLVQSALSRVVVPESVTVALQLDEALPTILADADQLSQVFGNLILNAVQAMHEGGRFIIQSQISSPGWVCVSVSDTGVGIPPENLDRLFEPLFTTKARGIGLGLAIVKSLVEGHGGQVEVQSQVEKGSTFTIVLPIKPEDARL